MKNLLVVFSHGKESGPLGSKTRALMRIAEQQGADEWQEAKQDQKQILLRVDTHAGTRMAGLSDDDDRLPHSYAGRQP